MASRSSSSLLATLCCLALATSAGTPLEAAAAPTPMPVISRSVPYVHSGGVGSPNDDNYTTVWYSDLGMPQWLAYDLSEIPAEQRGQVVLHWINNSYSYSNPDALSRCPKQYTIDAHAAPGGAIPAPDDPGWVTLVALSEPNSYHSRQHVFSLTDEATLYNWVRLYVTEVYIGSASERVNINMDVHDAHLGANDTWMFFGDSLTAGTMSLYEYEEMSFPRLVNAALPQFFPAQENGGVGGWTAADGASHIPGWLAHVPAKHIPISFGTNDGQGGVDPADFYAQYEVMVNAVIAAGKVPIIPTIPWNRSTGSVNIPSLNAALVTLKSAHPEIIDGPDFWTFFSNNQDLIAPDNLHFTEEGERQYRRMWAETMLAEVYGVGAATLTIDDASVAEGEVGTKQLTFTVTTSAIAP